METKDIKFVAVIVCSDTEFHKFCQINDLDIMKLNRTATNKRDTAIYFNMTSCVAREYGRFYGMGFHDFIITGTGRYHDNIPWILSRVGL